MASALAAVPPGLGGAAEPRSRSAPSEAVAPQPLARRLARTEGPDPCEVEARVVALARAAAPLRRGLARVAGRLLAGRGYERLGFARASDYARERAGVSGRQLQELARVDRAFVELPELACAFSRGDLSWTQARLVARVATPEDTARWLERAAELTARELSREVRAVDPRAHDLLRPETDEDGEEEWPEKETVLVHCTPAVRAKWYRTRFLASRLEGRPLPRWAVAERVAAEALAAIPLDEVALDEVPLRGLGETGGRLEDEPAAALAKAHPDEAPSANGYADGLLGAEGSGDSGSAATAPAAQATGAAAESANACATGAACAGQADPELAWLWEGLDDADAFELDHRLRRALDGERRLEAQMGPALLAVARGRLYRRYGCSSLREFAREWLGISPRKAEALLRLERAAQVAPALRGAYRAGPLSWVQAQLLVPLVRQAGSGPWHAAWVARASRVSVRRLDDEVAGALASGRYEPPPLDPPGGRWEDGGAGEPAHAAEAEDVAAADASDESARAADGSAVAVDASSNAAQAADANPQTGAHPATFGRTVAFFFTAPRDVARLFRGALATVQRRIEQRNGRTASPSEALDAMLEHAFATWQLANAELQREHRVFERDGWRCTLPGCTSYGNLHDHHIAYRSHGGSNALWNRTTLCVWHHQRGEHAKVLRCRGRAPAKLRFDLGLRPGRPPLARYRSGDVRLLGG
jgi:hypothetical protein